MQSAEMTWDQRLFDRTLRDYMRISSRTTAQIINTKAYYIARRALWYTAKASPEKVRLALGESKAMMQVRLKSGKFSKSKRHLKSFFAKGEGRTKAPLLALIVQKQRRLEGKPSPWKGKTRTAGAAAMLEAMRKAFQARMRSIGFLKAGWLPAIRTLSRFADLGAPFAPIDARQYGRPKGRATPGKEGWRPIAEIENMATTYRDKKGALIKFGGPALQQAFDEEAADMRAYMERKLRADAEEFNGKQK